MSIVEGDKIPALTLKTMVQKEGKNAPQDISTEEIFSAKKVVLFSVPGAFTPGCSLAHLPGFVVNADKIKAAGVDTIACLSVNDVFVMGAWGEAQNASEILMLADGNAEFTEAMGLQLDATGFGMGTRSQRYAMIVDDGRITALHVEQGGGIDVSSAEAILALL